MWRRHPYSAYIDPLWHEIGTNAPRLPRRETLDGFRESARQRLQAFMQQVLVPHLPADAPALTQAGLAVLAELRDLPLTEDERRKVAEAILDRWLSISPSLGAERNRLEDALTDYVLRGKRRKIRSQ